MEFSYHIAKLQGALSSLGRQGFLDGDDLNQIGKTLKEIFKDVNEDEIKLQMLYFMILNTDLPVSEQLKSDENIGLFVCLSIPLKLKQTVEIIWEVGLHSQFNEIIENCDSSVTKDFIIFILENDKFWKSDDNFKLFFNFWRSLFYKIHYIGKGYQEDPNIMTMTMFFEKCMQLINEQLEVAFKTPLWEKNTSTKNNFFYFFNTVLAIIRFYNDVKYQYEPNNVFKLSIKFQSVQDLTLIEPSKACLNLIFTYLPKLMQGVSMNSWKNLTDSAWQEVKENIYYICKETMDVIPQALQHLEPFAVEPDLPEIPTTDIDKIISHVKRGEKDWFKVLILQEEIEKKTIDASSPSASPDKNAAVGSMMNKTSEDLQGLPEFNNIEVIDCLLEKFNFADPDDHFIILKKCVSSLLSDKPEELEAKIRKLFLKALKYESPNENSESFLTNVFRNHANAIPRLEIELDSSETEDFNEELNLAFNKFSNEESVRLYDVARLCLQSREKCLIKIYRAAINDSKQVNVCLNVVNDLKGAFECRSRDSDHLSFLESVLLKFIATEKLTEKEQNLFILFFRGLVQKNLIDFKFYDEIISILNLKLQEESYEIIFFLQLIKTGIKCKSFEKFKFCFLLFMSDVLKSLSWNFDNFSNVKAEGRNLVGSLVLKIIGSLDQAGEMDYTVREHLLSCSEIDQAYFCDMWFRFDLHWPGSQSFQTLLLILIHTVHKLKEITTVLVDLHRPEKETRARDSVVLSLATLLPFLTSDQWDLLFSRLIDVYQEVYAENERANLDSLVLGIFSSALYLLTLQLNRNEKMSPCYEYCLRNYGRLVKCSVERSSQKKFQILEKTLFFLQKIRDVEKKELCSVILLPVLADLVESALKTSNEELTPRKINGFIKVLNVKQVDDAIGKRIVT